MKPTICIPDSIDWDRLRSEEIATLNTYQFLEYLGKRVINPGGSIGLDRIIESLNIRHGARVLDIGAGTGHAACRLAREYGCQVTAIDLSARAITAARQFVSEQRLDHFVSCEIGDINRLRFPDGYFDYVICQAVVMFVDHAAAFTEIARVLKSGGQYGGLEFCWRQPPSPKLQEDTYAICGCSTLKFHHLSEWHRKLRLALPDKSHAAEYDFDLLTLHGFLRDEGWANALSIGLRLLRHPAAIRRMAEIWRHFSRHADFFGCVIMVGAKA